MAGPTEIVVVPDDSMRYVNTPGWVTPADVAESATVLRGFQEVDVTSRCCILFKNDITDTLNLGASVVAELYVKSEHQLFVGQGYRHTPWNTPWPDELGCVGASEFTNVRRTRYGKFFGVNELLADDSGCILVDGAGRSYLIKEVKIPIDPDFDMYAYRLVAFPLGAGAGFGTHTRIHETGPDSFVSITSSVAANYLMTFTVVRFTISYDMTGITTASPYITFRTPVITEVSRYITSHTEAGDPGVPWWNPFHLESGYDPDTNLPVALEPYLHSYYNKPTNEVIVFNLVRGGIDNQRTLVDLGEVYPSPTGAYQHDAYNYYDAFLAFSSTNHAPDYSPHNMKAFEYYGLASMNFPVIANGPASLATAYHEIFSHYAQGSCWYGNGPTQGFYDKLEEPREQMCAVPGYFTSEVVVDGIPVSQGSLYAPVIKDGKLQLWVGVTYMSYKTGDTFFQDDSNFFDGYQLKRTTDVPLKEDEWQKATDQWARFNQSRVDHVPLDGYLAGLDSTSENATKLFSVVLDLNFAAPTITEVNDPEIYTWSENTSRQVFAMPSRVVHGMLPPTFIVSSIRFGRVGVYDRPCHGGANVVLVRKNGQYSHLAWPDGTTSAYPYALNAYEYHPLVQPDGEDFYFTGGWSYLTEVYKYGVHCGGVLSVEYSKCDRTAGYSGPYAGTPGAAYAWRYQVIPQFPTDPPDPPPAEVAFILKAGRRTAFGAFS